MTISTLMSTKTARWVAGTVMVAGGLMTTITSMNAWAAAPPAPPSASAPQGAPHGMKKMGGPMMGGAFLMDGRGMDRMLNELKATDAQRTQIKQIAEGARTDLRTLQANHGQLHQQVMGLLTQPNVDEVAAENLRQQMLTHHDRVSKRMMTAMLQMAQVLTPEQRGQLAQKLKARQERRESREGRHNG